MQYILSLYHIGLIFLVFCIGACVPQHQVRHSMSAKKLNISTSATPEFLDKKISPVSAQSVKEKPEVGFYRPGNDTLFTKPKTVATRVQQDGSIRLNFHKASLPGVVKVILGDMLQAAYMIDPQVQGTVSMQTGQPIHCLLYTSPSPRD